MTETSPAHMEASLDHQAPVRSAPSAKHRTVRRPQQTRVKRLRRRGMTLIEIMIVVVIMGLIASAVGFSVIKSLNKAKIERAGSDVAVVLSAAELHYATANECPTMDDLDTLKNTEDPWGREFDISCDDEITVRSSGPDGEFDSDDDISSDD